jgi:hypothetical protein
MDIYLNTDTVDSPLGTSGIDWSLMDVDVDFLIMLTNGSVSVADGQPIPSTTVLNQAGLVITGLEQVCSKYFLADDSANLLKQIHNMGAGNKRYVVAFDFLADTASEPVLQAWDDVSMLTANNTVLGAGTPSSSWIAAITTTDALPGVGWSGFRLAGDTSSHYLNLNSGNGALLAPKTLYAQLKVIMPSTEVSGGAEQPILVVKWTEI